MAWFFNLACMFFICITILIGIMLKSSIPIRRFFYLFNKIDSNSTNDNDHGNGNSFEKPTRWIQEKTILEGPKSHESMVAEKESKKILLEFSIEDFSDENYLKRGNRRISPLRSRKSHNSNPKFDNASNSLDIPEINNQRNKTHQQIPANIVNCFFTDNSGNRVTKGLRKLSHNDSFKFNDKAFNDEDGKEDTNNRLITYVKGQYQEVEDAVLEKSFIMIEELKLALRKRQI
ncbi:uncharacterized protein [Parasteatoda tepidariorum]|uniref:uncharacterized protein n=1 Tax=Parasteatoda tepidariorum TaxID=114398 RepID=UPI0039BC5B91